jgi:hypothetical protein
MDHKFQQGRILSSTDLHVHDEMLDGFVQGTWVPFEEAINAWLESNGYKMKKFDDLIQILARRTSTLSFDMDITDQDGDCSDLEVDWIQELAAHMLDQSFTTYDVANLEILTHLYAYHLLPVRPQCVWGNRASRIFAKFTPAGFRIFQV